MACSIEGPLTECLKAYQSSNHNWQNHKLNRDNPFETPLSCGVTNKMLATLFYVAVFEVNLSTVGIDSEIYGAGDHEYLLVGPRHEAVIVDGAWKQFCIGSEGPNILTLPSPSLDLNRFNGGLGELASQIAQSQTSKPNIKSNYTGMWGYENSMELAPQDLSEAVSRELLGGIYTRKPSSVLTNNNFGEWLKRELEKKHSPDPLQLILFELKKQGLITVV